MGAVTDIAFSVQELTESGVVQFLIGLVSAVVATTGLSVAATATRSALNRAQRRNDIEIQTVQRAIDSLDWSIIRPSLAPVEPARNEDKANETASSASLDAHTEQATAVPEVEVSPEERILASMEKRSEARFHIQTQHYANALRQSTTYFYLSVFVGIMGFILLATGVGLALGGLVEIGTVTGVGGLLVEGAAGLIFNQANKAKSDAQSNLAAIALAQERDENRQMALIYSSRITDPALRDSTNVELARKSLDALRPNGDVPALPPGSTGRAGETTTD